MIEYAWKRDEFILAIIYGPLRFGKSALAFQCLSELYGTWDHNFLRRYIGFHPAQVLKQWSEFQEKQKVYVWDDAGLWLNALEWNHPFTVAVSKYLNVAGTDWAGLILTAPLPTWISKKIRGIPQAITLKVFKTSGPGGDEDLRGATIYRFWTAPDMKKTGVWKIDEEEFTRMMPDPFFAWYKPLRDKYAKMAKALMAKAYKTTQEKIDEALGEMYTEKGDFVQYKPFIEA